MTKKFIFALPFLVLLVLTGCNKKKSNLPTSSASSSAWFSSFTSKDGAVPGLATTGVIFGATASTGDIYLSGTSSGSFIIRRSTDKGNTWATINDYGATSYGYGITIDSNDHIYAAGTSYSAGHYTGLIRKSSDGGVTWSSAYSSQITLGEDTVITAVTHDSADNLYAVGYSRAADPIYYQWITLKSTDHGGTWNLIDTYIPDGLRFNAATGALVASTGKIYVWGISLLDGGGSQVRMSNDGGNSWTTVYENWHRSIGSIVEWSDGLVMTESYDESGEPTTWRILGTPDDFAHLQILEGYLPEGATGAYGNFMKVDSRGYLYVNGYYTDENYNSKVVLLATRGDGNWDLIDEFRPGESLNVFSSDIFFDNDKGIFYAVSAENSTGGTDWVIRAGSVLSSETFTPDPIEAGDDLDSPVPSGAKRIFVTNTTHSGIFGVDDATAIAAADAICAADPNKPLGGGIYKALLVNSSRVACTTPGCSGGTSEQTDWVLSPATQYVRRNGTVIGTSTSHGLFDTFSNAISPYNSTLPWTGLSTYLDWTIQSDDPGNGNGYCDGWKSGAGSGSTWSPAESDFSNVYAVAGLACTDASTLLCVEQ